MSLHDDQTLIFQKIEKDRDDHHSKFKYITVLNDDQHLKGKSTYNRPHYQATTTAREDGPSWRRTPARPTRSIRTTHGGDRELVKLFLEDNQRLREIIIDLTK